MKRMLGKILRGLGAGVALLALAALVGGGWFYHQMQRSLPRLDGTAALASLTGHVTITRDALGVPTVLGANRLDVARALGWLHAQDRFFQMDLMRRSAAGELAELFGAKAVPADQAARVYDFRAAALRDLALLAPRERELLDAYADGVNAGRRALRQKPFEYLLLRAEPRDWRPEDSILVIFAMALELQDPGNYERSLAALRDTYGTEAVGFFAPLLTPADAAFDGSVGRPEPVPSSRVIDLRPAAATAIASAAPLEALFAGSNNFALSGAHTATGAALLANDMHLRLRVPNTWYRAVLQWPDHCLAGLTLPGIPLVIAGSNGHVAWGFTNACADTSDLVVVSPNSISKSLYKVGDKLVKFERRSETIAVKSGAPVNYAVDWTVWGPIVGLGENQHPLALHWTMQEPGAVNLALLDLEDARTVAAAVAIAHRAGMPVQNFLVVDDRANLAWTIAGQLPVRVGFDGRFPVSWAFGDRHWRGLVPADQVPVVLNPAGGRLWTANNRVLGEPHLSVLGDGGYADPTRAARIRDDLAGLEHATPADLLAVQLDDHVTLLNRWHRLLLDTLTPAVLAQHPDRANLRRLLADWDARARVDSVSYPLVREFREQVAALVFAPIFAPCAQKYSGFNWRRFQYEQPLWTLVTQQPAHLLNPRYKSWPDLLLAAADQALARLKAQGLPPGESTWGQRNRAQIRHPLARLLPDWLAGWLSMPADPLPGDDHAPRVQSPDFGASVRLVVSPGHEAEGILEMPGGESSHPLSPYFRAGHEAWVRGEPAPFLPGPPMHTLVLTP
ncbi:MAG: penicillin acylase family protein [Opitutales bacterium]